MSKDGKKRLIFGILAFASVILCAFVLPVPQIFEEAGAAAETSGRVCFGAFGLLLFVIFGWVGQVFADWVVGILMLCMMVIFGYMGMKDAFAGFTNSTWFVIIGGNMIALACQKTGILKRIALFLLQIFPPTYSGQVIGLLIVGTVLQPLVPSTAAKTILGVTLAMSIADALGYEKKHPGRYGLFCAAVVSCGLTAGAFKFAATSQVTASGLIGVEVGTAQWTIWTLPWLAFMIIVFAIIIPKVLYQVKEPSTMSKEYAKEQYAALGKISKGEIINGLVILGAIALWVEGTISAGIVGILAGAILFMTNILAKNDIKNLNWGLFMYIASVLSLGSTFKLTGLNGAIGSMLAPIFGSIPNHVLILVVIMILTVLLRFVIMSVTTSATIFVTLLAPMFVELGMHPFIAAFTMLAVNNVIFWEFQWPPYSPLCGLTDGGVEHKGVKKLAISYPIVSAIGVLINVVYWKMLGMM